MTPGVFDALRAVLAATPEPPAGADPGDLLAAGQAMAEAREAPLARLRALMSDSVELHVECAPLLDEINDRDSRWQAALSRAGVELTRRAAAVRRVRHRSY
jgi:hypothetical protein